METSMDSILRPRQIRPVPAPLGLYLRPGYTDHTVLQQLLSEDYSGISGVVFDASYVKRQETLRGEVVLRGLEAVLDPLAMELATVGGFNPRRAGLPWGGDEPHSPTDLPDKMAGRIADFAIEGGFSAVLAPTHFLEDPEDRWLEVDHSLTVELRHRLDTEGGKEVPVYYPLAVRGRDLRDPEFRERLRHRLVSLPIDALWLRVHPFGSSQSGPVALRGYIEACRDLHALQVPLVAERTGTVGLALLAFGAVGGIEGGITVRESFDANRLLRPPAGDGFSPPPRIYLPDLGAFLTRKKAEAFFEHRRMRSEFGCQNTRCCRRATDMLRDPRRHFSVQRMAEVTGLSQIPEQLRAGIYLDDFLRPATDLALQAARVEPSLESTRRRLESWRITLGAMHRERPAATFSQLPGEKRIRHVPGA